MYLKSEKSKDIYLGVIELGNKVVFSDPGYKELSWYNPVLSDVKSGLYRVYMNYDSEDTNRVSRLFAVHESVDMNDSNFEFKTDSETLSACVDSGQCGLYDYEYFMDLIKDNINGTMSDEHEEWYDKICNLTYVEEQNPKYMGVCKFMYTYNTFSKLKSVYEELEPLYLAYCNEIERLNNSKNLLDMYESTYPDKLDVSIIDLKLEKDDKEKYDGAYDVLQILNFSLQAIYSMVHPMFYSSFSGSTTDGFGAVSSSGLGDGVYPIYYTEDSNGKKDSFQIIYLFTDFPFAGDDDESLD